MLELQKVTVQYGGFTAVEDITFEVPAGQFVAVVGPTGCGKSSLLNLVAGLLAPAQGSVRTGARPVNAVNRDCGYMFQTDALLPWKTAAQRGVGEEVRAPGAWRASGWRGSDSPGSKSATRTSCPEGSGSGWRWLRCL